MAVAIIAGILFATFLTLILVPVLYSLVDDFTNFFRRWFSRVEDAEEPEVVQREEVEAPVVGVPPRPQVEQPEPAGVGRRAVPPPRLDPLHGTS